MAYAGDFNLITLQLADSSRQVDSRLTRMLATSLVVHAVLLLSLMSVHFAPTIQQPLASYQIDLVTLPEPSVAPPKNRQTTKKEATALLPQKSKSAAPVSPSPSPKVLEPIQTEQVTPSKALPPPKPKSAAPVSPPPSPKVLEPIQTEQVTPSIVDALDNVAVPKSRQITPMVNAPTVTQIPREPERKSVERVEIPLPVVPQAPQLSVRKTSSIGATLPSSVPATSSLAETLKQAVQSVAVPQKSSVPKTQASSPHKTNPISTESNTTVVASPKITTPGQAPQLAKVIPVPPSTKVAPKNSPQNRISDSLKKVVQSVVVSEVKKPEVSTQKHTQAVAVPIPLVHGTQQKPREKLQGMVIPSQAPKLAKVDVVNAHKSFPETSVSDSQKNVQANLVEPKIAKLVIPDVQVPEAHHILSKPTESGMQNTKTALQVSGSSPEGNAYWGRVWSKIDREWVAPPVEVQSGKSLQVVVAFRIERNGGVKNLSIKRSSGNEYYDLAAKRAILDARPLPQFAADMPESFHDIQFQFTVNVDS